MPVPASPEHAAVRVTGAAMQRNCARALLDDEYLDDGIELVLAPLDAAFYVPLGGIARSPYWGIDLYVVRESLEPRGRTIVRTSASKNACA